MVSLRCKMKVKEELEKLGLEFQNLGLGVVELNEEISTVQRKTLYENLLKSGLELMEDKKGILIERIKNAIVEMIHDADELPQINYSVHLSEKLSHNYTYLANIFSIVTETTIQQFIILHKIEKAKELLQYNELNLTEISYALGYSSVAHLSNQFKKVTGFSPTFYKLFKVERKDNLENMGILPHI